MKISRSLLKNVSIPLALVALGVETMVIGCTRKVYLPVEKVKIDTVYQFKGRSDSVLERDSIYFAVKGDTVVKEVYSLRLRNRLRVDTLYRTLRDTVTVTVSEPVNQAGIKSKFADIVESLKWACRCLMVILLIYVSVRLYKRLKNVN